MEHNYLSTARKFFTFSIFSAFIISIFCFNLFGQTKNEFGTLAAFTEKPEVTALTRPRIVYESKAIVANKDDAKLADKNAVFIPNTVLVTSAEEILRLERQAFDLLNERRKENGLAPVEWSEDMAKVARIHSGNMARLKFFSHVGQDGLMVNDRADALGFTKWKAIGENIAYNRGYDNPAEFACERWMLSPAHRENILNRRWKEAGVGLAIAQDGTYYFTEVFIQR